MRLQRYRRAIGRRLCGPLIEHDTELGADMLIAHGRHRQPMRQQEMMRDLQRRDRVNHTWSKLAIAITEISGAPRFIMRGDRCDAITKTARHFFSIRREMMRGIAVEPTTAILQRLR